MPGGWVSSRSVSDEHVADVQEAIFGSLVAVGWTVKESYRATYRFGLRVRTATPPAVAIPDSAKTQRSCGFESPDFDVTINGKQFRGYDPYRETPPPPPCVGYPLGENEDTTVMNLLAVINNGPYSIKLDAAMTGAPWGFSAVAKEPGARGDAYQFRAPLLTYDSRLGETAYPGWLLESPPDQNDLTFKIHFWDGNVTPSDGQANYHHCFRVYDSYGGNSDVFSLSYIFRDRAGDLEIMPNASAIYYTYEVIATEDSLLTIPRHYYELDRFTGEIVRSTEDVYSAALFTTACLYIARPVLTPEAAENGVEASLFCHLPNPYYGSDEMPRLPRPIAWYGLNDHLALRPSPVNWAMPAPVYPSFRAVMDQPKIQTARGDVLRTSVMMTLAEDETKEAGIVGKLNSMVAIADASYMQISKAIMRDDDGRTWKLVFQNNAPKREGYFYNFSLWMAESDTPCGEFFDPSGTAPISHRAISSKVNLLNDWTLLPNSESGNDAIHFVGGEGGIVITLPVNGTWAMTPGSYPAGLPGEVYYDVVDRSTRSCTSTKYVRIWGFPDCDRIGSTYSYTFRGTDSAGQTIDQPFSFTVQDAVFPSIHPASNTVLADGKVGVAALWYWTVGCPGEATWSNLQWRIQGTIPAGLTFFPAPGDSSSAGQLTGTPTEHGYYEFSITAYNSAGTGVVAWGKYKLTVAP